MTSNEITIRNGDHLALLETLSKDLQRELLAALADKKISRYDANKKILLMRQLTEMLQQMYTSNVMPADVAAIIRSQRVRPVVQNKLF